MNKKAGEELKNLCYSFTNFTSLSISIFANTRTKQKIIKMNSPTVVEGGGQDALF
jgi:hypothetical protein